MRVQFFFISHTLFSIYSGVFGFGLGLDIMHHGLLLASVVVVVALAASSFANFSNLDSAACLFLCIGFLNLFNNLFSQLTMTLQTGRVLNSKMFTLLCLKFCLLL
jgi:hypothetical protein